MRNKKKNKKREEIPFYPTKRLCYVNNFVTFEFSTLINK
jgi:hypothetical protein